MRAKELERKEGESEAVRPVGFGTEGKEGRNEF